MGHETKPDDKAQNKFARLLLIGFHHRLDLVEMFAHSAFFCLLAAIRGCRKTVSATLDVLRVEGHDLDGTCWPIAFDRTEVGVTNQCELN